MILQACRVSRESTLTILERRKVVSHRGAHNLKLWLIIHICYVIHTMDMSSEVIRIEHSENCQICRWFNENIELISGNIVPYTIVEANDSDTWHGSLTLQHYILVSPAVRKYQYLVILEPHRDKERVRPPTRI